MSSSRFAFLSELGVTIFCSNPVYSWINKNIYLFPAHQYALFNSLSLVIGYKPAIYFFPQHNNHTPNTTNNRTQIKEKINKIKFQATFLTLKQLKIVYIALVESNISYDTCVYCGSHNSNLAALYVTHKWILMIIMKKLAINLPWYRFSTL